jgi:hypothetical protein
MKQRCKTDLKATHLRTTHPNYRGRQITLAQPQAMPLLFNSNDAASANVNPNRERNLNPGMADRLAKSKAQPKEKTGR